LSAGASSASPSLAVAAFLVVFESGLSAWFGESSAIGDAAVLGVRSASALSFSLEGAALAVADAASGVPADADLDEVDGVASGAGLCAIFGAGAGGLNVPVSSPAANTCPRIAPST
jgi:hypothetical protein